MDEIGVLASWNALIMKGEREKFLRGKEDVYLLIGGVPERYLRQVFSLIEGEPNVANTFIKEVVEFVDERPKELHILEYPDYPWRPERKILTSSLYFPEWLIDGVYTYSGLAYSLPNRAKIFAHKKALYNEKKVKKVGIPIESVNLKKLKDLKTEWKVNDIDFKPEEYKELRRVGEGEVHEISRPSNSMIFVSYEEDGKGIALRLLTDKLVLKKFAEEYKYPLTKKLIKEMLTGARETDISITSYLLNRHDVEVSIFIEGEIADFPLPLNILAYQPHDSIMVMKKDNRNKILKIPSELVSSLNYLHSEKTWFKKTKGEPSYVG